MFYGCSRNSGKQDAKKNSLENRLDFLDLLFCEAALTVFYDLKWGKKSTSVWLIAALPPGFNIEASDTAKVYWETDKIIIFFFFFHLQDSNSQMLRCGSLGII